MKATNILCKVTTQHGAVLNETSGRWKKEKQKDHVARVKVEGTERPVRGRCASVNDQVRKPIRFKGAPTNKTFVIPKGLIRFLLRSRRFLESKRDMDRRCTLMDVVRNPVNTILQRREDKLEQRRKEVEGVMYVIDGYIGVWEIIGTLYEKEKIEMLGYIKEAENVDENKEIASKRVYFGIEKNNRNYREIKERLKRGYK
ncbi:hypothetical protein V1478_001044 [Vespula squamosa]|uniref:Uncharacterized protein n=1 Tax=Vespula squamosa TaxID=30214 RepID=A0ABD2C775_VESSQ